MRKLESSDDADDPVISEAVALSLDIGNYKEEW